MDEFEILNKIKKPEDLLSVKDVDKLCSEIRKKLVSVVSQNGGHLASNLGTVELTVALHTIFNDSQDRIIWDVGHQCYTHKMITGRLAGLGSIRLQGGISGFTNRFESEYDVFTSGHSSTSISAALGLAQARQIQGNDGHVIAVIGDGALTGGLAYEGLNNAGRFKRNFIVILNDNKMSISRNVGSISRYLTYVRIRPSYMKLKGTVEKALIKTPLVGSPIRKMIIKSKSAFKNILYNSTIFEDMGFAYYGPVDGHNISELKGVLSTVKDMKQPVLVHVVTTKGKGYEFAEKKPRQFHGVSGFDARTGEHRKSEMGFSEFFGRTLCSMAEKDNRICAITAAMVIGTGLREFASKFRQRFFDVGIAEEHAVTFAGGLAAGGLIPVFAVYSSFLQRGYDQIIHDAALQGLRVVIAVDRAGLIGEDGETHQGVFDVPFLNSIPNLTIFAPSFFNELEQMMQAAVYKCKNVAVVRYPRGKELYFPNNYKYSDSNFSIFGNNGKQILAVTYGRLFSYACNAQENLKKSGTYIDILKFNVIKPLDIEAVKLSLKYKKIFFFEESIKSGGIAEKFGSLLAEMGFCGEYSITAINDRFVKHATVWSQMKELSLDPEGMEDKMGKS